MQFRRQQHAATECKDARTVAQIAAIRHKSCARAAGTPVFALVTAPRNFRTMGRRFAALHDDGAALNKDARSDVSAYT